MKSGLNAVLGLFLVCANIRAATLFSEDFEKGLTKRWEPIKFQGATEYSIVQQGENSVLQGHADKSATTVWPVICCNAFAIGLVPIR